MAETEYPLEISDGVSAWISLDEHPDWFGGVTGTRADLCRISIQHEADGLKEMRAYVRENMDIPTTLPEMVFCNSSGVDCLRWGDLCPMGLLPQANVPAPGDINDFDWNNGPAFDYESLNRFAQKWDNFIDPKIAMGWLVAEEKP